MLILFYAYFRTESRSIVVLGGAFERNRRTVVFGPNPMILPPLPSRADVETFVAMNNHGQLIASGGISTECWILQDRKWVHHSFLNAKKRRSNPSAVSMSDGIYLFGFDNYQNLNCCATIKLSEERICEFLPNDFRIWMEGPQIPYR